MEERNKLNIHKSADPDELLVVHAESSIDQIRFYVNEKQFVYAEEDDKGKISVDIGQENEVKEVKMITWIKENIGEILLFSLIFTAFSAVGTILGIYIADLLNNAFIGILFMYFMLYFTRLAIVLLTEIMSVSKSIKSKHSAEHMMVNFLEANKRLPKNMEEIKSASRFSNKCGSRKRVEGVVQDFVISILSLVIVVFADSILRLFIDNIIIESIVMLVIYFFVMYIASVMIRKHGKMAFVIDPIKSVLNNLVQCINTTKKVEDKDILLAYFSAGAWMTIVYPEFYNKEEDVFLDNYSKS